MNLHSGTPEMSSLLNSVVEQLDKETLPTVRESDFVQNILPTALAVHSGQKVSMAAWVNVAGDVFKGVSVVDDTSGEVLYNTPGIYARASFAIEGGMTAMITEAAETSKLRLSPESIYAKHLNADKAKLVLDDSGALQVFWYAIFAKYGWKMERVDGEVGVAPTAELPEPKVKPEASIEWDDGEFI